MQRSRNQNSEYLAQRRKEKTHCHFDPFGQAQGKLREKSFSDPSHSLGMTGLARHLAFLASLRPGSGHAWREQIPVLDSHGPPENLREL